MKVLTLNTWQERGPWQQRWELIFQGLKKYDPEVVAFQEVFNMGWAREIRERSGYPYLAVSGEHSGLIFLLKFKPIEQACLVMKTKSPTEDYQRYAFYVNVDIGGEEVALFNTHLSWRADENDVRMKQTLELEAFVTQKVRPPQESAMPIDLKGNDRPSAIMGDFNGAPNTPPVVYLREIRKWIDTFGTKNPGDLGLTWDYRNPYAEAEREKMAERRIDFIFIRERIGPFEKILSSRLVFHESENGIYPSDHFGVMTEFSDKG